RLLDREARAALLVLAEMGDAAGERPDVADLHFQHARCGGLRLGLGGGFLLAAAGERHGGSNKGNAELHVVHGFSSPWGYSRLWGSISYRPRSQAGRDAAGCVRGGRVRSCGARLLRWTIYLGLVPG